MPLSTGDDASVHGRWGSSVSREAREARGLEVGLGVGVGQEAGRRWGSGRDGPCSTRRLGAGGGRSSLLVGPIGGRALDHRLMSVGLSSLTRSVVRSDSCWDRQARDETS